MKIDKKKLNIVMARMCLSTSEIAEKAGMPKPTLSGAIAGKPVKPWTAGKIAKALGVDVTDIIETEK